MKYFIFDLQRFAGVTISADKTYELDGVTYTAVSDAVLNLDDDEKVSGLASGKVQATVTGSDDSPMITFDATDGAIDFTATSDGEIISSTMVLPLKIISGEFTFNGSTLAISAGSDLAIVNTTDDYSLRNENHFVYDSTYIFSSASMTSDAQQVNSHFALSDGTNTRELDLVQLGKVINNFTQQGFTLVKGSSEVMNIGDYTITATARDNDSGLNISLGADGITLVPNTNDGALNVSLTRGDTEIISGDLECTSGSITFGFDKDVTFEADTSFNFTRNGYTLTATTTDKATTAIELTNDGKITFTPSTNDGGLNLLLTQGTTTLFGGELNVSGGTITFDVNMQKFSFTEGTEVSIKLAGDNPQEIQFKVTGDDASFKVEADGSGTFTITPDSGDGTLDITIKQGDKTIFYNNISVSNGSIVISDMGQTIGLTSGTSMTVTLGNYTIDITANDDASFGLGVLSDGSIAISPKDNDGSLDISISRGTTQIFSNTINISGGTITFNPTTQLMTLTSGTTINLEFGNYELTATAKGNAASSIALTDRGITITPSTGDGSLDLTLTGTSSGSLSANIEVLSGSFTLGDGGALTVAAGTELQIKFSDDYIINFKATDKAGGSISLGTDGITFAPTSDDGGLQLTVKRGDDTRSASLDVTGSVTYKLDGSISLTKGTVVKNVFDSGNILTITANTDASGSINFNPQTGLTIKPTTTDALTVSLTTSDIEVVKITSIKGSITYQNGIVTATDGTKARIAYYFGWESDLYTKGGTASVQFTDDRTIYTANAGATFTVNYLDGTTTEIQHGSYADVYGETIEDYVELVSEGTTLKNNDSEVVFTLEKAGDYNLNGIDVTTSEDNTKVLLSGDYDTVQFAADAGITVSATEDKGFRFGIGDDGTITITTTDSGNFGVSSGSITFGDGQATIAEGTTISLTTDERVVTFTANKDISVSSKIEEDVYYLTLDAATADVTIAQDEQTLLSGEMVIDGVFSYRPETGTFGLTGANSSHGDGNNTSFQFTTEGPTGTYTFKAETNDTTVVFIPNYSDGKFEMNFPNEAKHAMKFTVSKDGQTVFENNVAIDGTIGFDTAKQELSLTKDTVLTLTQGENSIEITALGDAGGKLNIVDGGLRFAPNTGDGQLELNFVSSGRKANIDVTGAVIFGEGGKISLENGTEVTFTWDDGTELKLTSAGSTGSIGIDEKGIKITSEDENLTIDLTTATGDQSHLSGIKGTIYYNAGRVLFDDNSTITATTTLGGEPILMTLETIGGTGHLEFASNGVVYSADTGAMQITWKKDDVESTFTVNSGSVQIGHGLFQIAEGTELATDLKDFVPALYFTTSEAGTYTINGQTITTSAANISMTATDDYMTFKTSDDAITYDDMTFAGNGNVSLSTAGVVLGAGVVADGFGKDKMFILAEAGNVTADARIFELTEEVPTGISVTGAEDGFIFSRINTEESEAQFDDPDPANVGKIFTEEFFLTNDDSYRIQTDLLGLQQIIGVSSPATIKGTATFDGEPERTVFDVVTETEGVFTVADKDYSISGDDSVAIKVGFEPDKSYVRGFDSLSGTVSGDFTAHEVSINGSASAVQPIDDTLISISADDNGFEVLGLDKDASLKVAAQDSYVVNGTTINANAGDYIMGLDNGAALYGVNNDTIITGTEGNDTIQNIGTNVTINALGGDDSISNSGDNASIDAGSGSNQIKVSGKNEVILLKGQTTVEGFNTGFGDGSDTIYIKPENDPAGVEFLEDGLTFGNDTASLTLSDVTTTAKVNLFHENRDVLNKGVFIAAGDWYEVEDSDLTVDSGEEVYFVGTAATPKAGVDFSKVTTDLNVTLDTEYEIPNNTTWINGVYSIKGGAGNTTITGSDKSDTIISGTGLTTINAGDGDDYIINDGADNILRGSAGNDTISNDGDNVSINGGADSDSIVNTGSNVSINAGDGDDLITNTGENALFKYYSTGGNDTITGFDSTSTLSIADEYSSSISGNDLIVTVGDSKITLVDAATLSSANIETADLNPAESLVESILKRTAAGYPVIAGLFFNPEEITGPEPTNYSAKEDWTITSSDNLELYGVHYTPEKSNDKWVVLVHGYGCMYESMNPFATFYLANNYNVLMIDQRAAGKSEGTWLTMGGAESKDVALWTQEIVRRNSNAKITLHGVSMGSATAMLAASRSDAANVVALVEDCGYTSAMKLFYLLNEAFGIGAPTEVLEAIDGVAEEFSGHYLSEATPINAISSAKMPTLFISGDDDGVVPVSMLSELYDASGAEVKEKFIVAGAGHAQAGLNDPVGYSNAVFRFVAEANGEGWETTNITDNISLGGTKYNDTITNYGNNVTINAVGGDDSITNTSEYSIIDGGAGNDTIINYSPTGILASNAVSINAGADDDTIINEHAYYVTLNGGAGDDKIIVRLGDHTTIDGGAGNDTIIGEIVEGESSTWAMGGYSNINGGAGDDYINPIFSDSASIRGGEGNDTIINEGDDATINGGAGDDVISLQGASLNNDVIKYEAGDGNDIIYGFNETTKLSITAGTEYSTTESGDDVIVKVGDNTITIAGGADLSTINIVDYETPALNITNTKNNTLITATENNDTINNSGSKVSISGAAGNDSIVSSGTNDSIHGGAGSDTIRNSGAGSSIFGAEGDDRLINTADEALVDGGYGNDAITNSGDSVTIKPGGGFDSVSNSGDNVVINYTGGNDSIQGFNATSTLSLSSDDYEVVEGSRNIFVFSGESFAVLQGAFLTNDSININDTAYAVEGKVISLESGGDEVAISRSNVSIVGGTGDDIIILTSDAANNTIEYAGGNDTIYGFNETSKLTIAGEHSSIKIGDDVFVTVGNNIITLVDASSVMATDFEDGERILLTEKGAVTVGNRVFELTERVKSGVTITGTADGFTSGITNKDGSVFVEEFIAASDDSYHVFIDGDGLQTISGIDAGTKVTTSATKDGVDDENQIHIVTEDAGKYTFNNMKLTTTEDNATIGLIPDAMTFDAAAEYDGKTFTGDGKVAVSVDAVIIGASVSATGFENGESFILAQKGSATVDGRVFELTEDISDGMTIESADNGYTFSHTITQKEVTQNNLPSSYAGKIYSENVVVEGDETYSLRADTFGLRRVRGISGGATILGGDTSINGQYFYVDTDTEGVFTIGEKTYSISGDSNVEIVAEFLPEKSYASGFNNLEGTVRGDFDGDEFIVNGSKSPILVEGDDSISVVGSSSGTKLFGVSGNATLASLGGVSEVHTDTEGEFWIAAKPVPFGVTVTGDDNVTFGFNDKGDLMTVDDLEGSIEFSKGTGGTLSINGIGIHTRGIDFSSIGAYDNSLYIHDIERGTITAYELEKVWLQMSGETMTLNGNELTLTADSDGIWLRDKEIVGLDEGASLQVSEAGTYTANTTELEAKAGDVIVGLEGDDAYIYNGDNLLITTKTPNANIISHFAPNNYTVVGASSGSKQDITLSGGDLAIVEATSSPVNITAGDDTIVSQGENVAVSLTGGNTWLFPIGGKMTLEGYDASTSSGFGTTYADIASAVKDGTIDFNNGHLKLGSAQIDMDKRSELMNFFDRDGRQQKVGYASSRDSLDVSNETDDLLLVAKKKSTLKGGAGNDTILAAERTFIDAGAGSNLVSMTSDSGRSNIVFNGNTTVEGFHAGFGSGSDTVYISEVYPAVDFKDGVLTFYDDTNSLTFKGITKTAQINTYSAENGTTAKEVYIADDEWYDVADGKADYYVGATAKMNHGIDFSSIRKDLNVTLNTDYDSTTAEFWVNNVHSIKGGAGNTSITGSDKADTILAGVGRNSIWSGAGDDLMFGNTDEAKKSSTFFHTTGDGYDTIEGFDFTDSAIDFKADVVKLGSAVTGVSLNGEDVVLQINNANDSLTLTNAKGKTFRLNDDLIAKVGDSEVAFDDVANCYAATGSNATLMVGSGMNKVEVWLGDTSIENHGTMFYGDFKELNAAQADGTNILAGNELSNVITGGSGRNSLWGGAGSAGDMLIGGTGHNDFFYCAGNGNDAIQNAHDGDNVILDGITLDQITSANIYSGSVSINFNDGGSLRLEGTADVTYQLGDGSRFSANHSRREWVTK